MAYGDGGRSWTYTVREHRVSASLVGLAAILMLLATLLPRGAASAAASGPPAVLFPANGAYFGSWVAPRSGESTQQAIQRVESQIGRRFAIDHQYYKWDTSFPTSEQSWTVTQGRIPFVNWKAQRTNGAVVRWSTIASGAEDAAIIARADAIKAFGYPIYLAFHHEPEDDLDAYGTPADYAEASRHIVTVFRSRGVTNVAFVWTMMSWSFNSNSGKNVDSYYPGTRTSTRSAAMAMTGTRDEPATSGPPSRRSSNPPRTSLSPTASRGWLWNTESRRTQPCLDARRSGSPTCW